MSPTNWTATCFLTYLLALLEGIFEIFLLFETPLSGLSNTTRSLTAQIKSLIVELLQPPVETSFFNKPTSRGVNTSV